MAPPSITIVTPCLNARATIKLALASVRTQGYAGNVEHLVIDGGSSDGTLDLLESAEGVRFISEPDRGLSDAVNKGIRMAGGDVIGWLNADDVYLPGALTQVGAAFGSRPDAEWATGRCIIIDADGHEIRRPVTAYKDFFLRRYSFRLHLVQNFVSCPSTFVRRSAFDAVGLLDERFRYSMDYDLWLRLAKRSDPIVIEHALAAFRMAEGSLSMSGFEQQFTEHVQNAREHGNGHSLSVTANRAISRLIVATYHGMRRWREAGATRGS